MRIVTSYSAFRLCTCGVFAVLAACTPKKPAPLTISDLMHDRVMLDGVLMKCNEDPAKSSGDVNCLYARTAVERLAQQTNAAEAQKRQEEFERNRDKLRQAEDREREAEEAKHKVDPYSMPVVPVDGAPASAAAPPPTASSQP